MKKQFLLLAGMLMLPSAALAQIGINTATPVATLDVVGTPADKSKLDGVIAPRITGDQLRAKTYTNTQTGAIVYVTLADTSPAGQTINVTQKGYFYFDGNVWTSLSPNVTSGDPTRDAWIDNPTNTRVEVGTLSNGTARPGGTEVSIKDNGNLGVGIAEPTEKLDVNGKVRIRTMDFVSNTTTGGSQSLDPVFRDANGVLVKSGNSIISSTQTLPSGGKGNVNDKIPDGHIYKGIISLGDGCADIAVAEFYINSTTYNGYKSITGLGGNIGSGSGAPTFTQIDKSNVRVTWPNKGVCQDGTDSTGFNFRIYWASGTSTNIVIENNGNKPRTYTLTLTQLM